MKKLVSPGTPDQAGLVCLAETATAVSPVRADGIARELQPAIVSARRHPYPDCARGVGQHCFPDRREQSAIATIHRKTTPQNRQNQKKRYNRQKAIVDREPSSKRDTVHGPRIYGPRKTARMSRFIAIIGILVMVQPLANSQENNLSPDGRLEAFFKNYLTEEGRRRPLDATHWATIASITCSTTSRPRPARLIWTQLAKR